MDNRAIHRPRNVGWARAAALLYGDWGTSKAYVIGVAFYVAGYASLPIILAVCALTGLVGYNYIVVCKNFPDGGGVYSSARLQNRLLAVVGALLLVADLTVTASLSGWAAMAYFQVPKEYIAGLTMVVVVGIGLVNFYGPKHTGSIAVGLALPMVAVVVVIILLSIPHLTTANLEQSHEHFSKNWTAFVGVILALSGVEAIANLTGVMPLDPGSTHAKPRVVRTARKSILIVALEVVGGTALLGWAMLSLPLNNAPELTEHWDDMLTQLAIHYGNLAFGVHFASAFGVVTALIVGLLLLSAVNTAVVALIGLLYFLAKDGEMPAPFARLNRYGVPWLPILIATVLPVAVIAFSPDQLSLMELYAIGVVGAITVNLGSCVLNKNLTLAWYERGIMFLTTVVLSAVELTLAKTKPNALFFIVCILIGGLALRAFAQRGRHPLAAPASLPVSPDAATALLPAPRKMAPATAATPGGISTIMVAARGMTPVVRFALDEAQMRGATLYVLYVRMVAVNLPVAATGQDPTRWQDDPQAAEIMSGVMELNQARGVPIQPLYAVSDDAAGTIVDLANDYGANLLILGATHRRALTNLLKGNVVTEVASSLPEHIHLLIHG